MTQNLTPEQKAERRKWCLEQAIAVYSEAVTYSEGFPDKIDGEAIVDIATQFEGYLEKDL